MAPDIKKMKVVIDCDTGVDDAQAILYALLSPNIDVVGITTVWGNASVDATTANTLNLLELVGRPDIPVGRGADKPLVGPAFGVATWVHGSDGLGGVNLPPPTLKPAKETAAELIVKLAHQYPGELTLLPIGPMTNIGAALALDPSIAKLYKNVVIMGGAFLPQLDRAGGIGPQSAPWGEANVWHDPEAAQMMFEAGWHIVAAGVDVTMKVRLTEEMLNRARDSGPVGAFIHKITQFYMDIYSKRFGYRACAMHDAVTILVAEDPSLITHAPKAKVAVELRGTLTRGLTIVDLRRDEDGTYEPNTTIILDMDIPRFLDRWMDVICNAKVTHA